MLANGDLGDGRMPDEEILFQYVLREIAFEKDLAGKKVLVTAGATREPIDPVRFITNHSSGKMGCAVAKAAMLRGADVTLVHGNMTCEVPTFVKSVPIMSAGDMFREVTNRMNEQDIIIKAAAVADYTPMTVADNKIKKTDGDMSIPLKIAVCPAPSASYPRITCSAFLLSSRPCASVRAVPSDATTFVIPR